MDQPRTDAPDDPTPPPHGIRREAGQEGGKPAPNRAASNLDDLPENLRPLVDRIRLLRQAEARQERFENRDRTRARKLATRARIIVGGALMAEARTEPSFAATVLAILERRVVDVRDRDSIGLGRDGGLDRLLAVSRRSAMALRPSTPGGADAGRPGAPAAASVADGSGASRDPGPRAEAADAGDRHDRFGQLLAELGGLMREHGQAQQMDVLTEQLEQLVKVLRLAGGTAPPGLAGG